MRKFVISPGVKKKIKKNKFVLFIQNLSGNLTGYQKFLTGKY